MSKLDGIYSRVSNILTTTTVTFGSTFAAIAGSGVGSSGLDVPTAWTQYISSGKLTGHALTNIQLVAASTWVGVSFMFDVGSGAAGSEVSKYKTNIQPPSTAAFLLVPVIPFVTIPNGERVAMRVASNSTGSLFSGLSVYMNFVPRPY